MNTVADNAFFTTTILPISNERTFGGSVLPDRFVSGSDSRQIGVVGSDLGSTIRLGRQMGEVIVPVIVA